jgi:hypothetical protein
MYRSKWSRMRGISPSLQKTTKWSNRWYTAQGATYSISPIVQSTELKKQKICFDFKFNYNEVFFKLIKDFNLGTITQANINTDRNHYIYYLFF